MTPEPRQSADYGDRQTEAARRVLIDLGQVLASFADCLVVVGGWVPDLLLPEAEEPHIGSIDIDLALDAEKLGDGRYAEMLKLLFDTKRYQQGEKAFQLIVHVDLKDGQDPVRVEVEFLAPKEVKLASNHPKLIEGFRVLQIDGCDVAFAAPVEHEISGLNVRGADNTVSLHVTSLADFLVMKALAIGRRDKPKDSYDFCYCLQHATEGPAKLAEIWKQRTPTRLLQTSLAVLRTKFSSVNSFGPQQVVEFHNAPLPDEQAIHARRAYELVQEFLRHFPSPDA